MLLWRRGLRPLSRTPWLLRQGTCLYRACVLLDDQPRAPLGYPSVRAGVRANDEISRAVLRATRQSRPRPLRQPVGQPVSLVPGDHRALRARVLSLCGAESSERTNGGARSRLTLV